MSQTVAFVGVGKMGANMARRLKETGHSVTAVLDVNMQAAADLAAELGCKACTKLADVTAAADVIFTVVTNDASMRGIFFGSGDSLLTNAKGKIFINCATLSPAIHREVYAAAETAGAHSLEACMASSMGGGMVSFSDALATNRKEIFTLADHTVLCPGHGPLTTVGEEKTHNPFYPEFKSPA